LSIDAVQQANSGHPGTPMALAPAVYTIWNRVMSFDPDDPIWPNRDRFVLDDIKRFRRLDSKAAGHPQYHWTSGVETRLGQGVATSVGMAMAQKWLASRYNRTGAAVFNHRIFAVCGDGRMMEGAASEAASLAAHLGLDDNSHITIEGNTRITFTEDVAARFLRHGWSVLRVGEANDVDRIEHAFDVFRQTHDRRTIIILDSHIGYGAPHKQDTAAAHGEPLGEPEVRLAKRFYGWPEDAKFLVADGVRAHFAAGIGACGADANEVVEAYRCIMGLRHQPAVLVLSRQPLPTLNRGRYASASGIARGAYVLADTPGGKPDVILIASGSEVSSAIDAHERLIPESIRSRVVSMPSWDLFEHQSPEYRDSVLPFEVTARVAVERAFTPGWDRYVGAKGKVVGMHTFGASAPLKELQKKFGFEPEPVSAVAKEVLRGRRCRDRIWNAKRGAPRCTTGNRSRFTQKISRTNHTWRPS
jgi:transketolase